jgi:hypothetical protein
MILLAPGAPGAAPFDGAAAARVRVAGLVGALPRISLRAEPRRPPREPPRPVLGFFAMICRNNE